MDYHDDDSENNIYEDDNYGMSPEEAGYTDGEFDSQNGGINGTNYGASIDLNSLTDDERDEYESAYYSAL